jgi:hypothetical protein
MTGLRESVRRALSSETRSEFERRVREQADAVAADARDGRLDNRDFAVGLELEAYAVDEDGRPTTVPESAFDAPGCGPELGLHNVEMHTSPDVVSDAGFRRQAAELDDAVTAVRRALAAEAGGRLVLDATWTVPPESGSLAYLDAGTTSEGVFVADNMRPIPRYVALDNAVRDRAGGRIPIDLPGLADAASILVESLATSMQPHLQVPAAADVPRYLNVATRTMGPVLSLATNSPFLPADRYEGRDPAEILAETPHEVRIPVFERSVNVGGTGKCTVPRDAADVEDVVDAIVADETLAASLSDEPGGGTGDEETYAETHAEFGHARGTYWRWVRPVFGGDVPSGPDGSPAPGNDDASVRIEYRPLPTQPTVRDTVGMQALVVGLLRGVVATDHPLERLSWEAARDSFYAAVADGPDATLRWVANDGTETTDSAEIRDEMFALARAGLDELGVGSETVEWALSPIETRREAAYTAPSEWKRARVREQLAAGDALPEAVVAMQTAYAERAGERTPFAAW